MFDELLANVKNISLIELSQVAGKEVFSLKEFKLTLIERLLVGKIKIHLSPELPQPNCDPTKLRLKE